MNVLRFQIIVAFFLTVSVIVLYRAISSEMLNYELKEAQVAYERAKIQMDLEHLKRYDALEAEQFRVKRANVHRYDDLNYYGIIGIFGVIGLVIIIVALGLTHAKMRQASVYIAKIGQHSTIPIHQKDLQRFYPIAVNLSLAEIEASASTAHERAYRISRQMMDDISAYTRALAGKQGMRALGDGRAAQEVFELPRPTTVPTFADLLRDGRSAPGKPIVFGHDRQGQPQYRSLQDLKAVAIAGWQGSGKTLSMGYLIASSVLAYGVQVYVIDPHKHHPESLSALIHPLERTGRITVINPFDTPTLLEELNQILDRRLAGQDASEPGILLVIDEMARLAKMECFDRLVTFLERCTEETRKANITFIGGSHKWTARHFKGRADIRACMNSMLIHKTKPSQADLLVEDAHEKNLVKQLQYPGDAILVTDYAPALVVSMPLCTRKDMDTVAGMLNHPAAELPRQSAPEIPHSTPIDEGPERSPPVFQGGPGETPGKSRPPIIPRNEQPPAKLSAVLFGREKSGANRRSTSFDFLKSRRAAV